jgi:hypothetical protein
MLFVVLRLPITQCLVPVRFSTSRLRPWRLCCYHSSNLNIYLTWSLRSLHPPPEFISVRFPGLPCGTSTIPPSLKFLVWTLWHSQFPVSCPDLPPDFCSCPGAIFYSAIHPSSIWQVKTRRARFFTPFGMQSARGVLGLRAVSQGPQLRSEFGSNRPARCTITIRTVKHRAKRYLRFEISDLRTRGRILSA